MLFRSLRLRILLTFALVLVTAIGTITFAGQQVTVVRFQQYIVNADKQDQLAMTKLLTMYKETSDVPALPPRRAAQPYRPELHRRNPARFAHPLPPERHDHRPAAHDRVCRRRCAGPTAQQAEGDQRAAGGDQRAVGSD